jgi:hypothetical protein
LTLIADRDQAWRDRLSRYYRELEIDRELSLPGRLDLTPFDDAMCTVVEDTRPNVVSFHFGLPDPALLQRVKAAGCAVMSSATTVEEALCAISAFSSVRLPSTARPSGALLTSCSKDHSPGPACAACMRCSV